MNSNIKSTFFCTRDITEHLPENVKIIEQNGHELACHSLEKKIILVALKNCVIFALVKLSSLKVK